MVGCYARSSYQFESARFPIVPGKFAQTFLKGNEVLGSWRKRRIGFDHGHESNFE
jgi:hypothetical protein